MDFRLLVDRPDKAIVQVWMRGTRVRGRPSAVGLSSITPGQCRPQGGGNLKQGKSRQHWRCVQHAYELRANNTCYVGR